MTYTVVFFTHSGALKFDRHMKNLGFFCELMPVPRKLSSNCGIGAKIEYDGLLDDIISTDTEKIFNHVDNSFELVYSAE